MPGFDDTFDLRDENSGLPATAVAKNGRTLRAVLCRVLVFAACWLPLKSTSATAADSIGLSAQTRSMMVRYCRDCHTAGTTSGELSLDGILDAASGPAEGPGLDARESVLILERVLKKLHARQMPPPESDRPEETAYSAVVADLTAQLDRHAARHPRPGRTETLRRLTRTEYQNAVRDLLALEIDASAMLPADESSGGFDNVTVGELSPMLLSRYITAAQKIASLAVGRFTGEPAAETFRVRADLTQESHLPGLPFGTRGGTLLGYHCPQDGYYDIQVRLARDRNEHVEGLRGSHQLVILLDRRECARFTVRAPKDSRDHSQVDAHLQARIYASGGPHQLGVTFVDQSAALLETERQPYQARFNMHRHPRTAPAVFQVSIIGPYDPAGPGNSPSRQRLFEPLATTAQAEILLDSRVVAEHEPGSSKQQASASPSTGLEVARQQDQQAETILQTLVRRAFRRPVTDEDVSQAMRFFRESRDATHESDMAFDAGLEAALTSVLVNPQFLFRIERDPASSIPGQVYQITDLELASRMAFFLWSSLPDDELLQLAERNELSQSETLERQVLRMLADPRAEALLTNFVDQWLYLRNLESLFPDMRLFPDFDDNLRQAMRRETELFAGEIMLQDRSVLELLQADYTYLNERLARHYGIPHVYGDRFRRVSLDADAHRGGLLRQASILTVTSYATRTSPVIRGHWVLHNLIGSPPPPPPPDVPALEENTVLASLPIRERLQQHRADTACAGCHRLMDPIGFALENFDATGRWRERDGEHLVDALGGLPDGREFQGVQGLEHGLLQRPELFVGTLCEKLMTFALGRGITLDDAAAVRGIVRSAAESDYRFSALVRGIVLSTPFRMRTVQ